MQVNIRRDPVIWNVLLILFLRIRPILHTTEFKYIHLLDLNLNNAVLINKNIEQSLINEKHITSKFALNQYQLKTTMNIHKGEKISDVQYFFHLR